MHTLLYIFSYGRSMYLQSTCTGNKERRQYIQRKQIAIYYWKITARTDEHHSVFNWKQNRIKKYAMSKCHRRWMAEWCVVRVVPQPVVALSYDWSHTSHEYGFTGFHLQLHVRFLVNMSLGREPLLSTCHSQIPRRSIIIVPFIMISAD